MRFGRKRFGEEKWIGGFSKKIERISKAFILFASLILLEFAVLSASELKVREKAWIVVSLSAINAGIVYFYFWKRK